MTDKTTGPAAPPTQEDADEVSSMVKDARRTLALRMWVKATGPFDADEQAAYGVGPDGVIGASGLTAEGARFADDVSETIDGVSTKRKARHSHGVPSADFAAMIDALGMRGPFRAAVRGAAQALMVALDDGQADDAGIAGEHGHGHGHEHEHERDEDGSCIHNVRLGGSPFVLLQAERLPNGLGTITLGAGGGIEYMTDAQAEAAGEGGALTVETALNIALEGVLQAGAEGAPVAVVDHSPGGVSSETHRRIVDALNGAFGPGTVTDPRRRRRFSRGGSDGGAAAEAEVAESLGINLTPPLGDPGDPSRFADGVDLTAPFDAVLRQADAPFRDPGDSEYPSRFAGEQASGSGPSTEAPAMPSWSEDDRTRSSETAAPEAPVRDAGSEAPSSPATSSDSTSNDSAGSGCSE